MSENIYLSWLGEKLAERCVENLIKNGFDARFVQSVDEASKLVLGMISGYTTFGLAGSATTRTLGLKEKLEAGGKTVYDHWKDGLSREEDMAIRLSQGRCECLLLSANAVSATGELVNVDGIGNRTAAMTFGPRKVVIVAGMNKVTMDLESALKRVREVAAPMRARSLGLETPCALTGMCEDCNSPQRICRVTTILHRRPLKTDISVILVNEALGF